MKAPEALKSNTREVCLCFSNFHDTHIPVGVGTRRSFLLSGPGTGLDPSSVLSTLTFKKISPVLRLGLILLQLVELLSPDKSRDRELIIKFRLQRLEVAVAPTCPRLRKNNKKFTWLLK
jgi:hypothetical protein